MAKPFLGFSAFNKQTRPRISHSILVKSFTKRKPESLQEGLERAQALRKVISDPPRKLVSVIILLMAILLPFTVENISGLTQRAFADTRLSLLQPVPAWLLTGKLSI